MSANPTRNPLAWPTGWPSCGARYEVTDDGQIISITKRMPRTLAQQLDRDGYPCVLVRIAQGKRRLLRVHRAVCESIHGPKPSPVHLVRHLDGDKRNNHSSNLCWGTHAENEADSIRLGEKAIGLRNGAHTKPQARRRGSQNGNSKLTADKVRAILVDQRSQSVVALEHGICQSLVSQIKRGRVWCHVTGVRLAAQHHPDRGGDPAKMAELNQARDEALQEVGR